MALQFKPLKLENTDLFGVRVSGTVGRGDRDRLKELADKCLKNEKVKVLLDLSGVGTMGGGGARMITELNDRLAEADGGAFIAGAGDTVRRFLDRNTPDKPLDYYATVEEALNQLGGGVLIADPEEPAPAPTKKFTIEGDADGEMDQLLGEFTVAETRKGRRKDHRFTSLGEALTVLEKRADRTGRREFAEALKNLLFSQGLAEDVTLLMADGGLLISPDGYKETPRDGALARQTGLADRPLTMLDIQDEELSEEEISLLEAVDPDLVLPVMRDGELYLMILIKKGGQDREYSVAESFAFELLQQILERAEGTKAPGAAASAPATGKNSVPDQEAEPLSADLGGLMLRMALDLPEADDLPHFWRLFSRHLKAELDLQEMAFLSAGRAHAQIMLGGDNTLAETDFSEKRLQKYFSAMERPVQVDNVPETFKELRAALKASRVNWITSLRWEGKFLGTLLLNGEVQGQDDFSETLLETFGLAGRLFLRFEARNENADEYLELIHRLMAQREKRFFGSADMTGAIVEQLNLLAQEMGFPPDQKRDLIYGCLLRDVGLIDKDDALMGSPADMTPNQWKSYRSHPTEGASLLGGLNLSQTVLEVVKCHHERFNGEGFPGGLSGRDIPLAARVVTVVENYVAMTTGAGGMEPRSPEDAAAVLRENLGERYDPDIVSLFLSVVKAEPA
jgi:HD-GYP domain-containing protein (c-di-GMP phosphodiesterase class II)/anti-anti-sigma regulatory factor